MITDWADWTDVVRKRSFLCEAAKVVLIIQMTIRYNGGLRMKQLFYSSSMRASAVFNVFCPSLNAFASSNDVSISKANCSLVLASWLSLMSAYKWSANHFLLPTLKDDNSSYIVSNGNVEGDAGEDHRALIFFCEREWPGMGRELSKIVSLYCWHIAENCCSNKE